MKKFVAAAMAAGAVALAIVPAGATARAMSRPNIVQVAASNPQFSTLVKLVKAAGLVGALEGKGPLTVFAPTNAAFAKVPKATLGKLAKNKALLRKVLLYHVVAGAYPAARVVKRSSLKTLEGASVKVSTVRGKVFINRAQVIKANVRASNGIIHVINAVLLPPGA
jgi:uncharacterized surface protein with fasciclin (FAS1) repeats